MTTSYSRFLQRKFLVPVLVVIAAALFVIWPARLLRSENFIFYLPNARYVVPLKIVGQAKYLPLLQVLSLVGNISNLQEKRTSLKLQIGETRLELRANEVKVRVNKRTVTLPDPVRKISGQWVVPVQFLPVVLSNISSTPIRYQEGRDRVFIGNVKPETFTVRLEPLSNGVRLQVKFTGRVSVQTASSNGKWVIRLGDHPIEPLEQAYHFNNRYIRELKFDDQDGHPKLIITPRESDLNFYPTEANRGKIFQAEVLNPSQNFARQTAPPSQPPVQRPSPTPPPATAQRSTPPPAQPAGPVLPIVVLDPGHGGADTGAHSRDGILEKNLVEQIVAQVRTVLLGANQYRVVLTRTGDTDPTLEQRAVTANTSHPLAFITFHAGNLGDISPRIVTYSYQPSAPISMETSGGPGPLFLPWRDIQLNHVGQSRELAEMLQHRLAALPAVTVDPPAEAPVRPLRSINAPAVAIEVGSMSPNMDAKDLTDLTFQQEISTVVLQALQEFQQGGF